MIIDGSQCVGLDCVNGENFGFDTIRLKENNLRIKAVDTSSAASFPTNDWQITFNESANGGANKFSIDDIDAGRTPFTIEAGAPSHSLYVDQQGDLGLGTSIPAVEAHIVDGDTPTVRLDQNGTLGWSPQTWDVAGNEANFFIRDATNGSQLPFRIRPGAPTSSIDIRSSEVVMNENGRDLDTRIEGDNEPNLFFADGSEDRLGIGLSTPQRALHLNEMNDSNEAVMQLTTDNTGSTAGDGLYLGVTDADQIAYVWNYENTNLILGTNNSTAVTVQPGGNMTVVGDVTANGVLLTSSRDLKRDIRRVNTADALSTLNQLEPVEYRYKRTPDEEHIGFIAEEMPDLLASKDGKTIAPPEILAVVTKVVKAQQQTIETQQQMMAALTERLDQLEGQLQSKE
ncbi:MAG: tail fiber domain-containing protein [Pseudomonadales bacterium]